MKKFVIKNANILDGNNNPAFKGSVVIEGSRIADVIHGDGPIPADCEVIDANGLTLAPGFIDAHGHSDMATFLDADRASKLEQGITTEICGQCGMGGAVVRPETKAYYVGYYQKLGSKIWPGYENFTSMGPFLEAIDSLNPGINLAVFIPQGNVRIGAMGLAPGKADSGQIAVMQKLVEQSMEEGAMGLSTGLMYPPGSFTDTEELIQVAKPVAKYNGFYTSHIRNQADKLIESVTEAITIAQNAGIRCNISHHKASGRRNWGKVKESLALIDGASIPVTHDTYPYAASSTTLVGTLPPSFQKMGNDKVVELVQTEQGKKDLYSAIFNPVEDFDNALGKGGFESILLLNCAGTPDAEGLTIAEYAKKLNISEYDAYIKLIVENRLSVTYAGFEMSEDDVISVMTHPKCMFGTDGLYVKGMKMTHPRAIGSFPRILGHYVREAGIMSLPEAVWKMTGLTAKTYGFDTKGVIEKGRDADLVLFDPQKIIDRADFKNPLLKNEGISKVFVNGVLSVDNGVYTGKNAGKTIKHK